MVRNLAFEKSVRASVTTTRLTNKLCLNRDRLRASLHSFKLSLRKFLTPKVVHLSVGGQIWFFSDHHKESTFLLASREELSHLHNEMVQGCTTGLWQELIAVVQGVVLGAQRGNTTHKVDPGIVKPLQHLIKSML